MRAWSRKWAASRRESASGRRGLSGIAGRVAWRSLAAGALAASWTPAIAGHEVGFYPSYYPHEIRIETLEPAQAAALLAEKALHAYIGAVPGDPGLLPDHVKSVNSLGTFLVLGFNPQSPVFGSGETRCAAARDMLAALRSGGPDFVFHPHPVTPYHADYLHHLDRIEESLAALASERPVAAGLKIRAEGRQAEALAQDRWELASEAWDVSLEDIAVDDVIADAGVQFDAWLGPPWVKEGWFQAYRLLAPALADAAAKEAADSLYSRLLRGDYLDLAEKVTLERQLLAALGRGCERMVVGYTVDREFYNDDFSAGVENIAYDSQTGLNTPVFIRSVKLKDFPWNGELDLGIPEEATAAWNPVAGFTDAPGRLIWSALGDPALLPMPYNASWIPNRLEFTLTRTQGQSGGIRVPAGSLLPEAGSGRLQAIADPTFASTKLVYTVSASPFLDGTDTEVADLLYAFTLAYRWGVPSEPDDGAFDPHLAAAVAGLRERLAGIRVLRVEQKVNQIAPDVQVIQTRPVLEIYLRDTPGDSQQIAALAPPWSSVPWHLMALMEEAVLRGYAAFSQAAAERRGVAWLDLARDASLQMQLRALIDEFEAAGYRPAALQDLVSDDEARARWRALGDFAEENGHLLVTNGPYFLKDWRPGAVVLGAVREASYPMGFGTFDQYVLPLRAVVREVTREDDHITVRAEAEKTVKIGRAYQSETVPLDRKTARGIYGALVASRYLLIGPGGAVIRADKMDWQDDGRFDVALPEDLPPGRYRVLVAVYLDGNSLLPSTGMLQFETGG